MTAAKIEQIAEAVKTRLAHTGQFGTYTALRATWRQWLDNSWPDNQIIIMQSESLPIDEDIISGPADYDTEIMLACIKTPSDTTPEAMDTLANQAASDIVARLMSDQTLSGLSHHIRIKKIATIDPEQFGVCGCVITIGIRYRTDAADITQ